MFTCTYGKESGLFVVIVCRLDQETYHLERKKESLLAQSPSTGFVPKTQVSQFLAWSLNSYTNWLLLL